MGSPIQGDRSERGPSMIHTDHLLVKPGFSSVEADRSGRRRDASSAG
jgi:hypothetical protein